ncbi:AzlD domain-containing protein [Lentibacter algarum]|uniref:AzlD domain-containing protein n=1 Tax=Lentibacter algarum TaxID=576131 RepID=UPI001C076C5A|nr:AzlD domain-containing protein [Lentibacter algarum]MBU2981874.1 AzlD domain-containing protein [Lentibacter algarum]
MIERPELWFVMAALAVGSFTLRFLFVGLIGDRPLPAWLLRHLRYTAVAVLPALIAPMVVWPAATGGTLDLPRFLAAAVTLAAGLYWRNVLAAITLGAGTLYLGLYLLA